MAMRGAGMSGGLEAATLVTAGGCALVGGVFFAFSSFVMDGLGRLPDAQGTAAMQSINRSAVTPAFMAALFGTGAACAGLVAWSAVRGNAPAAGWLIAGGSLLLALFARWLDRRRSARRVVVTA